MGNEEYLIVNTTKEERTKIIKNALALTKLDAKEPLKEDMKFYKKYINGEIELDEAIEKIIEKYKKN